MDAFVFGLLLNNLLLNLHHLHNNQILSLYHPIQHYIPYIMHIMIQLKMLNGAHLIQICFFLALLMVQFIFMIYFVKHNSYQLKDLIVKKIINKVLHQFMQLNLHMEPLKQRKEKKE